MSSSAENLCDAGDENDNDDDYEGLSMESLEALKELISELRIPCDSSNEDERNILSAVRNHFDVKDKNEKFIAKYSSKDGSHQVEFCVNGLKKELGQTLSSTGLTVWRACEHMCTFIINYPQLVQNKTVCELGAGLGLLAILIDKMEIGAKITATDGDDDTIELLSSNVDMNDSNIDVEKLWWGLHDGFLEMHPEKFQVIIAADVIYESDQVIPLLSTAKALLEGNYEYSSLLIQTIYILFILVFNIMFLKMLCIIFISY